MFPCCLQPLTSAWPGRLMQWRDRSHRHRLATITYFAIRPHRLRQDLLAQTLNELLIVSVAWCGCTTLTEACYVVKNVENTAAAVAEGGICLFGPGWAQRASFTSEIDKIAARVKTPRSPRDVRVREVQRPLEDAGEGHRSPTVPRQEGPQSIAYQDLQSNRTSQHPVICVVCFRGSRRMCAGGGWAAIRSVLPSITVTLGARPPQTRKEQQAAPCAAPHGAGDLYRYGSVAVDQFGGARRSDAVLEPSMWRRPQLS